MTLPTRTLSTLAGMPVDPEEERWLALDRECDRLREAFRKYGRHHYSCDSQTGDLRCSCGFEAEWARVFGATSHSG